MIFLRRKYSGKPPKEEELYSSPCSSLKESARISLDNVRNFKESEGNRGGLGKRRTFFDALANSVGVVLKS